MAGRFDRDTRCTFCNCQVMLDPSAVEAEGFRDAFAAWDDPGTWGAGSWCTVAGTRWLVGEHVATGGASEAYRAARGRFPTEKALIRVARLPADHERLTRAWDIGRRLQASTARGSALSGRLPEPITCAIPDEGAWKGRQVLVLRWAHGHDATLHQVGRVSANASAWILRRVLEALAFMHAAGIVHGAVTTDHVLVERGEHGARLVGLGSAGEPGGARSVQADLRDAARAIVRATGGDPASGEIDAPAPYAGLVRGLVRDGATPDGDRDAWSVRERVGSAAATAFGRPTFCPVLPP